MNTSKCIKAAVGLGLLGTLSGCGAYDVAELREKSIDQSSFSGQVAEGYRKFVAFEADEMMDWQDAGYFAAKALRVLEDPQIAKPENFRDWNIDEEFVEPLNIGEGRLKVAMRLVPPKEGGVYLAKAITSFDCWVEQAEEGWQTEHIAACQSAFDEALVGFQEQTGIEITENGEAQAKLVVYHELNNPNPRNEDLAFIQSFAKRNWGDLQMHIHVTGHADRSGSEAHNDKLSVTRAVSLVRTINAMWPGKYTFSIEGLGESQPAIATPDGIPELKNRRTEAEVTLSIEPEYPSLETATR